MAGCLKAAIKSSGLRVALAPSVGGLNCLNPSVIGLMPLSSAIGVPVIGSMLC